nr:NAD(P)-dependent oxidoreductase [Rhizobium sp. CFBP 8762]
MRIVMTGATGFLGTAVATVLAEHGADVTLLARMSSVLTNQPGNVVRFESSVEAGHHVKALAPDVLIHLAAAQGRLRETAVSMVDTNVTLSTALLEAMGPGSLFINTATTLPPDVNLYAQTKRQFVDLAHLLVSQGKIQANVANTQMQMIYGAGDDPVKFIPMLALHLVENTKPLITTPANQKRDFVHVNDAASAILALINARSDLAPWQDVPIGSGNAVPLSEFIDYAINVSGFNQPWEKSLTPRPGEPPEMVADTTFLKRLGWSPQVTLKEGISELIEGARSVLNV